jgi:hypothetical protein
MPPLPLRLPATQQPDKPHDGFVIEDADRPSPLAMWRDRFGNKGGNLESYLARRRWAAKLPWLIAAGGLLMAAAMALAAWFMFPR